ncbi:shikimate dehydrogenase [Thalassobacillus hwangdonensis]|uniref:Shikimate dehydrogenase (NADP(+)) n=1 Tax=Thalassobacillus hwangdonensis TaxID=546108 RepID=A0ABW3KY66_9BACI
MKLGLIGYPISHSLSPWIHQRFIEESGRIGAYELYELELQHFSDEVAAFKELGLDGFNVTVPYKQKIIPYLDRIDREAEIIGAVNTVKNENGCWTGYNTDGKGFVRSIRASFPTMDLKRIRVLVLGAGGAAKGIVHALMSEGVDRLAIANRTLQTASDLIEAFHTNHSQMKAMTLADAEQTLGEYDLIVQTTSVGMKPAVDDQIISLNGLKKGAVVSDIVYQPLQTAFLTDARTKGARIHHGHEMLVYQAAYAFEIWTGVRPDPGLLINELKVKLS